MTNRNKKEPKFPTPVDKTRRKTTKYVTWSNYGRQLSFYDLNQFVIAFQEKYDLKQSEVIIWGDEGYIEMAADVEETDEEYNARIARDEEVYRQRLATYKMKLMSQEQRDADARQRKYEQYLRLKKEFEDDERAY